jgi:glyoxylase-like metal-dependent hydrolase (beta-lactamase superfamily II)
MRLSDDVLILELPATLMGGPTILNVTVLLDEERGHTLVDTGIPGMEGATEAALAEHDLSFADIRQVIITHHDGDHIGSLPAVVTASAAQVWALGPEIPYIDGRERPQKLPPQAQIDAMLLDPTLAASMRAMLTMPRIAVPVDRALSDGETLPLAGGVRVISTPGHTYGHLSLYLERSRTLITGDALTSRGGELHGPPPQATPDKNAAAQSVQRLSVLDVQTIVTYHGGVVSQDAGGQLRRVAGELLSASVG